jgi:hypothetical protein
MGKITMSSENTVQRKIWLKLGSMACRLFRMNSGRGWISGLGPNGIIKLTDGSVIVKAARPIALGFSMPNGDPVKGVSDLPGWMTLEITPEMVGKKVAIFTSMEIKATTGGRASPDQKNWFKQVNDAGGLAAIVNSEESAIAAINEYIHKLKQPTLL